MRSKLMIVALACLAICSCKKEENTIPMNADNRGGRDAITPSAGARALPRPPVWVDCILYRGVLTPVNYDPAMGPFDELYMGGYGFEDGVAAIADTRPGDKEYNGGRWHLNRLRPGVDPYKYQDACSVEDLDLNDFMATRNYFECPLLPPGENSN